MKMIQVKIFKTRGSEGPGLYLLIWYAVARTKLTLKSIDLTLVLIDQVVLNQNMFMKIHYSSLKNKVWVGRSSLFFSWDHQS